MNKILLGLVLLVLFQNNLYAKKPILWPQAVNFTVDEWIVEVKNYYNQSAGSKIAKSSNSLSEAETNALNACKEDKIFNLNKPEGCLLSKKTESYERTWRYDMGVMPPKPVEREVWDTYVKGFLASIESEKEIIIKEAQDKANLKARAEVEKNKLEKIYSSKCNFGYTKGTEKYNNCLLEQEKKDLAEQKKKQDLAEASRKKSQTEAKQIAEKLVKMSPDDRRAYNCTEKFGFRKGSDKFKDCIFELYKVESELEKLELQKKVAQANLEAAKAKETASRSEQDRAMALLQRQTSAQELSAAAALQQARIADFESNQRLFDRSMELLSGDRNLAGQVRQPQQRLKTNCTFNGRFMNCN
jgi:hypothetical protein